MFRLAKWLANKNRDVVDASCVKDDDGKIVVKETDITLHKRGVCLGQKWFDQFKSSVLA